VTERWRELVLARPVHEALAEPGLQPDPLLAETEAFRQVANDELLEVLVDLRPASRRRIRSVMEAERKRIAPPSPARQPQNKPPTDAFSRLLEEAVGGIGGAFQPRPQAPPPAAPRLLGGRGQLLEAQVLLHAAAPSRRRANELLDLAEAAWAQWSALNYWRGRPTFASWVRLRARTGLFYPPRRNLVTVPELGFWLKPPVEASNLWRPGGAAAAAGADPALLVPDYVPGTAGVLPIGKRGERRLGAPLSESLFMWLVGRASYGKSTIAQNLALHLSLVEKVGFTFFDPHQDSLTDLLEHLTDAGVAERVVWMDLKANDQAQVGWNLFDVQGISAADLPDRQRIATEAILSAMKVGTRARHILTVVRRATATLLQLSQLMVAAGRPDCQPTLFQLTSLLGDEEWRNQLLPWLPDVLVDYWSREKLPEDSMSSVMTIPELLRDSPGLVALLGQSQSTFSWRQAIDSGKIVLVRLGKGVDSKFAGILMLGELVRSALSRAEVPKERRILPPYLHYLFLDELQSYDGENKETVTALLEECRKFGLRAVVANQNPRRLSELTYQGLSTNHSHILSSAVDADAAMALVREWGGDPGAGELVNLAKYHFLARLDLGASLGRPKPFEVEGFELGELWSQYRHPERVSAVTAAMDKAFGRKLPAEVEADLGTLEERILQVLESMSPREAHELPGVKLLADDGEWIVPPDGYERTGTVAPVSKEVVRSRSQPPGRGGLELDAG